MSIATRAFALSALLAIGTPALAAGPFDGTYSGTLTNTVGGGGGGCGEGGAGSRTVNDSKFEVRWVGSGITLNVAADGTIDGSGTVGRSLVSAKGKIANGVMTYDINSQRCAFRFEGRKR